MLSTTDKKNVELEESSLKNVLDDSRSAILNVLDDQRQTAEEISNSRSAILNVLDDQRQTAEEISNSRSAILNVLDDQRIVAEDLTDSKRALLNILDDLELNKQALEQSLEQEKASLLAIGDGVFIVDANRKITFVNKAFQDMLGWNSKEVKGKDIAEVILIEDEKGNMIPNDQRPISMALLSTTTTSSSSAVYYFIRKDSIRLPVSITASAIVVRNKIVGAVEIFRDISKEKQIDRAKTEFVSLASHQLRTPLSAVNWYTEMLLAGDAGEVNVEQKKYLNEIYYGNQRMVELVNALLNVSRLELGTFVVEPKPTDVLELVRNVMDEQKSAIDEKKLILKPTLPDEPPIIQADTKLLRMVVQNLLSNSVKYTPVGGTIELVLSLAKAGEPVDSKKVDEESIALKISDTGYGIPKNQQDKIFTKLFRADNVREQDTEGTGLGLYIVKSIVDHSGGKIWFKSEKDKGTTFFVTLPLTGMKKKEGDRPLE